MKTTATCTANTLLAALITADAVEVPSLALEFAHYIRANYADATELTLLWRKSDIGVLDRLVELQDRVRALRNLSDGLLNRFERLPAEVQSQFWDQE